MAISWWRSWHGAPTDHKWQVIAARANTKVGVVSAVAWALLDYASQQPERGSISGFDPEEYAIYSGFAEDEIIAILKAMNDKGIIDAGAMLTPKGRPFAELTDSQLQYIIEHAKSEDDRRAAGILIDARIELEKQKKEE